MDYAQHQREFYNKNCQDKKLLENSILIEMDFKQKIKLGQISSYFFFFAKIADGTK